MAHELPIPTHQRPILPGEILAEEFLQPLGITISAFAEHVGMTRAAVSEIIHGKRGITPITAMRFAKAFGNSEQFWLNLQTMVDRYDAMHSPAAKAIAKIKPYSFATACA